MAFMEQEITDSIKWIEIDSTTGTWFVPANDVLTAVGIAAIEADEDGDSDETLALVADYCEGKPQSARIIEGFGARLSAPGYLDCTDWAVFDSEDEAKAYLDENYGDDDQDEEDTTMAQITYEFQACDDCVIAIANDDYSGMDDATEALVRAGIERLSSKYGWLAVTSNEPDEFVWRSCECCGQGAGRRHDCVATKA